MLKPDKLPRRMPGRLTKVQRPNSARLIRRSVRQALADDVQGICRSTKHDVDFIRVVTLDYRLTVHSEGPSNEPEVGNEPA
jgi:hypothetical protein